MKKAFVKYWAIAAGILLILLVAFGVALFNQTATVPDVTGKTLAEATALLEGSSFKTEATSEHHDTVFKDSVISQDAAAGTKLKRGSVITLKVSAGVEPVSVPSVVGLSFEQAEKALSDQKLTVVKTETFSDDHAKGTVISQSIQAGKMVDPGSKIEIVISKASALIVVPSVTGNTLADAKEVLNNHSLKVEVRSEYSDTVSKDVVISQNIVAGTTLSSGSAITLKVSAGVEPVSVPSVIDLSFEQAKKTLSNLKFKVTKSETFSDEHAKGTVISQSIKAGKAVDRGSKIEIVVSKGPALVAVPSVIGNTLADAKAALSERSLKVEVVSEYSDTVRKNVVMTQNTAAGTKLSSGSVIVLKVSAGIEQITVPAVVGLPAEQAQKTLADLKFEVVKTEAFSDDYAKGTVTEQSVDAGDAADKGSKIKIVISKGPDLVQVPDVVGKSAATAAEALSDAGLDMQTEVKCSDTVKEGLILSQDIKAGEWVKRSSTVVAYVSAGVSNTVGSTPSNSQQFGIVATQGDWVYFSNMGHDYYLYKMRANGTEKQILAKGVVVGVNVVGEWIYYTDESSQGGGLYRIRIDGSQKTKLLSGVNRWVYVAGDWIYYAKSWHSGSIYRMRTDGTDQELVTYDVCASMNVVGNWIYYIDTYDNFVYKIRTDGTDKRLVSANLEGYDLVADANVLFNTEMYTLQKINTDGSHFVNYTEKNKQKSFLNACDGWLYFIEHDFNQKTPKTAIYKMKYDATQKTKLLDLNFKNMPNFYLNVAGDWIYFQNEDDDCRLYRIKTDGTDLQKVYQ